MIICQQTRGFLSSADQLTIDLPFAETKSINTRSGLTPTFARASAGTYLDADGVIKSALAGVPRFEHDSANPSLCRGLLYEGGRTNLILQSENHASASWSKTGGSISSATVTTPTGGTTGFLFSEDSSTGPHRIFASNAYVTGTYYAISVFLKYAGRQYVTIQHPVASSSNNAIFDIQNGTVALEQSGVKARIRSYPNGWYRCSVSGLSAQTATQSHLIYGSTTGTGVTSSYAGSNGPAFYVFGSQVEAGVWPSSYIQTTTAAVARAGDSWTLPNIASLLSNTEGCLYAAYSHHGTTTAGFGTVASLRSSATSTDFVSVEYNSATFGSNPTTRNRIFASTNIDLSGGVTTHPAYTTLKTITQYKSSDSSAYKNGAQTATSTVAFSFSSTLDTLLLGTGVAGGAIDGVISAVRVYQKRLPTTKSISVTT